jgi:hypothetical protein
MKNLHKITLDLLKKIFIKNEENIESFEIKKLTGGYLSEIYQVNLESENKNIHSSSGNKISLL